MAQMNISNTLFNDDSSGVISYAEQLSDRLIKNYINTLRDIDKTRLEEAGFPVDTDVFQKKLNEFFLKHWVDFQRFLKEEGVDPTTIDSWHEVQEFLKGLPDDEARWLQTKITSLETSIANIDHIDGGAFDISSANNVGGVFATFSGLGTALAAVPALNKKSGMAVRFIKTDTNEYEQYRYNLQYEDTTAGNAAFLNIENWVPYTDVEASDVVGDPVGDWVQSDAEAYIDGKLQDIKNWVSNTPETEVIYVEAADWPLATGQTNRLYRVAGTTSYSEYGWDGTQFILLDTKEYGIDNEPTAGSDNLVKSGGISNIIRSDISNKTPVYNLNILPYYIRVDNLYTNEGTGFYFPIKIGDNIKIKGAQIQYTLLSNIDNIGHGNSVNYAQGWSRMSGSNVDFTADVNGYLYILNSYQDTMYKPEVFTVNSMNYLVALNDTVVKCDDFIKRNKDLSFEEKSISEEIIPTFISGYWSASSGTTPVQSPGYYAVDPIIPVKLGDIIVLKNWELSDTSSSAAAFLYDANKSAIGNRLNVGDFTYEDDIYSIEIQNELAAYIGIDYFTQGTPHTNAVIEIQTKKNVINDDILPDYTDKYYVDHIFNQSLKNKKWTSFGDSITAQQEWQQNLIDRYLLIHTNCGVGSTCVGYYSSDSLRESAMCADDRIDAVKSSNPDIITIMGGTNDAHYNYGQNIGTESDLVSMDKTKYIGAYSFIINSLLTWKPTLRIIIVGSPRDFYANYHTEDYVDAAKLVAKYYGLMFVDLYNDMGVNDLNKTTYTKDLIHPNSLAGIIIAKLIAKQMDYV